MHPPDWNTDSSASVNAPAGSTGIVVADMVAGDAVTSGGPVTDSPAHLMGPSGATPDEATAMEQFFDQVLQFLQQGIASIFRFVQLIWSWSVDQITRLLQVPWQDWPLWKQIALVLVIGGVVYALLRAGKDLWDAGERILAAFATLLGVLVKTLPRVLVAGVVALGGVWLLNNLDLSRLPMPAFLQTSAVDR